MATTAAQVPLDLVLVFTARIHTSIRATSAMAPMVTYMPFIKSDSISSGWKSERQRRSARNEFDIFNRLKHNHVVSVVDIYQFKNRLNIIMRQVADTDLAEYLSNADGFDSEDLSKAPLKKAMQAWPGCLIQAIDYLHEMKVKHKDIKPANILVMQGRVLLADFGISKDLVDQETAASLNSNGGIGTRMYCAPEVLGEEHCCGRAADIFSLGCVFLEISTVLLGPKESLEKWSRHRETSGSRLYSSCSTQILQWIRYLRLRYINRMLKAATVFLDDISRHGRAPAHMAFLKLDPNSKTRIITRQMVAELQIPLTDFYHSLKTISCSQCRKFPALSNPNFPIHSQFKPGHGFPFYPDIALSEQVAPTWEETKKLWLLSHMWC